MEKVVRGVAVDLIPHVPAALKRRCASKLLDVKHSSLYVSANQSSLLVYLFILHTSISARHSKILSTFPIKVLPVY